MITNWFNHLAFAHPAVLWACWLIPVLAYFRIRTQKKERAALQVSGGLSDTQIVTWRIWIRRNSFYLRLTTLLLFILALARPQVLFPEKEVEGKGIDIIICMDVSGSMLAEDFIPNRLSAAKEVAAEFVSQRPADRIGVVLFSGEAYTLCPLTSDQKVITSQIGSIRSGMLLDGTAIGNGMATAIMDFPSETSKGKVMLLLTDGENNAGNVLPLEAANWAKQNRIRIYTIGMGTEGYAIMPTATAKGILRQTERVNLDEPLLKAIAAQTGGLYFRAGTKEALQAIWKEIDLLEQSFYLDKITLHREERYFVFVLIGLFLLVIEQCIYLWLAKSFP